MPTLDLSDPNISRLLVRLGFPAMAGLSLNAAHQVVDAGFVGHLGTDPLAVLALLAPFAGLVAAAGIGLGIGAASTVARALGENAPERARQITGLCFAVAAILSVSLWLGLQVARDPVLSLLNTPKELLPLARLYFPVQCLTVAFGILQILCDFTAIGRGDVRVSMRTLILCFGLNILLDPLFIFGFGLGLNGAAWATLTAQLVTLSVWAVWFYAPHRRPRLGPLRLMGPVLRVGLPEAGAVAVTTLGFLAVLRFAATTGGVETVAALGIALRLMLLVTLPMEGFAIGVQPILAHAFGAQNFNRVRRALRLLIVFGLGAGAVLALLLWLLAAPLCAAMSEVPQIAREATGILRWLVLAIPAIAIRLVAQISLQAAIRAGLATVLGLAPMGWMLWPTLFLLVPAYGASGLPVAITLAACLSAVLAAFLLRRTVFTPVSIGVPA